MRLAPDEEETRIADEASRLLADLLPIARLHRGEPAGLASSACRVIAELGWFELTLPESAGGAGMSVVEFALFFREAGRQCAPIELLTLSLAVQIAADHPDLRGALLTGRRAVALLTTDPNDQRLLGGPGDLAIEVGPQSARLLDVSGCVIEPLASLDPATPLQRMQGGTPRELLQLAGIRLWRLGQLAVSAMLVGIAEATLTQVVGYARIRQTFGKPIGAYQAVRHPCADMATRLEAARCQLWFAAAAIKESRPDAGAHLDAAKHLANESAAFATDLNIQLHGGIGVTDEHDAHVFMKHALLLRKLFGSKRPLLKDLLHVQFGA